MKRWILSLGLAAVLGVAAYAQDATVKEETNTIRGLLEAGQLDDAQKAIDALAKKDDGASVAANRRNERKRRLIKSVTWLNISWHKPMRTAIACWPTH